MKLIVAGGRDLTITIEEIQSIIDKNDIQVSEIVSGHCSGIDRCGETYAKYKNIPVTIFEANWNKHGKAAGPIRNRAMAEYADALLLIWNGQSRGSKNMKLEMQKVRKPIYEIRLG